MLPTKTKIIINFRDIENEIISRRIDEELINGLKAGECSVREGMFSLDNLEEEDYENYYKRYSLDIDLKLMAQNIELIKKECYYRDHCYYLNEKLNYEIQKMLQSLFPDIDDIIIDLSEDTDKN